MRGLDVLVRRLVVAVFVKAKHRFRVSRVGPAPAADRLAACRLALFLVRLGLWDRIKDRVFLVAACTASAVVTATALCRGSSC